MKTSDQMLIVFIIVEVLFLILLAVATARADDIVIYQTMPGNPNQIDREAPKIIVKDNGTAYYTIPGGRGRDYNRPGFRITTGGSNGFGTFGNQYRTDQPVQQIMPYVWSPQD